MPAPPLLMLSWEVQLPTIILGVVGTHAPRLAAGIVMALETTKINHDERNPT